MFLHIFEIKSLAIIKKSFPLVILWYGHGFEVKKTSAMTLITIPGRMWAALSTYDCEQFTTHCAQPLYIKMCLHCQIQIPQIKLRR